MAELFAKLTDRLSLTWRVVLAGLSVCIVLLVASSWIFVNDLRSAIYARYQDNLEIALNLLKDGVRGGHDRIVAEIRDGSLFINGQRVNDANDIVDRVRRVAGGVATIFQGDRRVATNVTRPDGTRGVGTTLAPGPAYDTAITRGEVYRGQNEILGRMHLTIYEPLRDATGRQVGLLFVGVPISDVEAVVRQEITTLISYITPILFIGLLLLWLFLSWQMRPVRVITERIAAMTQGEPVSFADWHSRRDEIGRLAQAMSILTEEVEKAHRLSQVVEQATQPVMLADPYGDFRITFANKATKALLNNIRTSLHRDVDPERVVGESVDIFHADPQRVRRVLSDPSRLPHRAQIKLGKEIIDLSVSAIKDRKGNYALACLTWNAITEKALLADRLEASVGKVATDVEQSASRITTAVSALAQAARIAEQATNEVSQAATTANSNVQTVASAAEQLSASIREISTQMTNSTEVSKRAAQVAEEGATRIAKLEEIATGVGQIVRLISDIASQTNLLALNATIEAARAGEAGKGFAVVASEVKNLAAQTAKATEDIAGQITAMQAATGDAVQAMSAIKDVVEQLNQSAMVISAAIEEQGAATQDIARSVAQVAQATERTSAEIARVVDVARSLRDETKGLEGSSSTLDSASKRLTEELKTFLSRYRQAA